MAKLPRATDHSSAGGHDLSHLDLHNLVAATDIAGIFLDEELRLKRFTPGAAKIFNLAPADIGRPLSDITDRLADERIIEDAQTVLRELTPREREIRLGEERWVLARLAPYRTEDDRVAGVVATSIDITDRKRAENEVRTVSERLESQLHKFNTVMTAVPDFIYHFDLEGRFTYANQALLDLWGKTYEVAVGKNFHELDYPPELAATLQRQIQQVIETRQPLRDETPYTSAIGERQYEYIFAPLLAADGTVEAVAGITRDITERKRVEQALSDSEERFRQFAENSADVFWILDAKTTQLEYLNPVYEKVFGQPRELIMRDRTRRLDVVLPEDRAAAAAGLPQALAGESFVRNYRIVRPNDGQMRWIRDTGFPICNDERKVVRIAGVAQDITADNERTEALRESEERFRLLVEGARDYAMFLLDLRNCIIYWSKGAERVFGWSAEEAVGQSGELIFTPEDRTREEEEKEMAIALRDGRAPDRRYHMRKDGSRFWADGVMMRIDNEDGGVRGFAKVARDATDQKTVEEALRHARDQMEQTVLDRTRDLMATNNELERTMLARQQLEKELLEISEREKRRIGEDLHDMVCQELTATALFLKSAANSVAPENPGAAQTLEQSAQLVNRNVGIARDLARGLQPADLKGAGLRQALKALAQQACENSGLKCHFKATRGTRVTDDTVALALYRVAQEAVKNAVKHSEAKNILISLDHDRESKHVCVSIMDDGKGFSPRRRSKGLGLHIMRYRANALGGKLMIEKRRTGGMDIICKLPVKK